jgi:hypothetical protein
MRRMAVVAACVGGLMGCGNQSSGGLQASYRLSGLPIELGLGADGILKWTVADGSISRDQSHPLASGKVELDAATGELVYRPRAAELDPVVVGRLDPVSGMELCQGPYSKVCELDFAKKLPNHADEGTDPRYSARLTLLGSETADGTRRVTDLLDYVLPSPDQEEGGTCLYMASTGAMEILLNMQSDLTDARPDGATDLSERFLMNAGKDHQSGNWKTDAVLLFNREEGAVRNRDYRYTKGWTKSVNGSTQPAAPNARGAVYGTQFNWTYGLSEKVRAKKIQTPRIKRDIFFEDPESNLWNTGIMERPIITQVKKHLREKNSPVMAIYNHEGYWHAAVIVGYDDDVVHDECPFVHEFMEKFEGDPVQGDYVKQIRSAKNEQGGCRTKGVFYVRDSIYEDSSQPIYDYDPAVKGEEKPYSKPLVQLEYEWLLYLGNHVYTVEHE